MDHEQLAAGDAAIRRHQAQGLGEFNDFVMEAAAAAATATVTAAAGTTEVSGARSEDQRPRQSSAANYGLRSGTVRTGTTTASAAAARARQHEDSKARDFREFDEFVNMQLQQQQQTQPRLQQPPSRSTLQQPPSGSSSAEGGGGEVAPAPASPDLELRH